MSTPYTGTPSTYTFTAYDAFSRPTAVYTPAGQNSGCNAAYDGETACVSSASYNRYTTTVTDPKGNITAKTVDALGEVTQATDAAGGITYYAYDPFGNLGKTTDANGGVTTMSYDTLGRKLGMTDPSMGTWSYAYDPRGLLTSQTDPKRQKIWMSYDALGRMISRTAPLAAGGTGTDRWIYDGPNGVPTVPSIGKLVLVQGADGYVKQYQYDSAGRPLETDVAINGTTYATNTTYDSFGRVASMTYPATPQPFVDTPPVAVAGPNQSVLAGQTVTLNGSGSYDPDHGPSPLSYKWVETSGPSAVSADGASTANASFSTTVAGVYNFVLTVGDGEQTDSASTSVSVAPVQVVGLSVSDFNPTNGNLKLSWSSAVGAETYSIEQSVNGGGYSLLPQSFSDTSAPLTGYGDGDYRFAVQGCGNNVCGTFSAAYAYTVLRVPAQPGTPGVTPQTSTDGSFTVTWSKPSGTVTYYMLYTSFGGSTYDGGVNVGNTLSVSRNETQNGSYYFKVAACNSNGCSAASAPALETVSQPVPAAPHLSANPTTIKQDGRSTLSWNRPTGVSATYFELTTNLALGGTNIGNVTSYLVVGEWTTTYYVAGCNNAGCGPWSNPVTITVTGGGMSMRARNSTRRLAPAASSGDQAPAAGLTVALPAIRAAGMRSMQPDTASAAQVSAMRDGKLPVAPATDDLMALRHSALHAEALRLAMRNPQEHPAAQPLYAMEVMTPEGKLIGLTDAISQGLINPYDYSRHTQPAGTTSRLTVDFNYDAHGNLIKVVDDANQNLIYWQAVSGNAFGEVTSEILGNGVVTGYGFDPDTGALAQIQSGVSNNPSLANWTYQWDGDGDLTERSDQNANLTETFTYDSLNRLTRATLSGAASSLQQFGYDAMGDLTSRSGVGTYHYSDVSHPQQISSISTASGTRDFSYDANGNTTADGVHSYTWDAMNRPVQILDPSAGSAVQIAYTPGGARYAETTTVGAASTTLTEVNALFEVEATSSDTYYRERIPGGSGIVAIRTVSGDGSVTTRYLTGDHLGSVSVITDEIGGLSETLSYGPFGERRNPANWQPYTSMPNLTGTTDKGYTGQQQMDTVGLVHMNGRVYDPQIGRMISADPMVPDPLNSQGFNRYAYVENNPLSATDPSGYCQTGLCEWLATGPGGRLEEYNVGALGGSGNYSLVDGAVIQQVQLAAIVNSGSAALAGTNIATAIGAFSVPGLVSTDLPAITGANLQALAGPDPSSSGINPNCNCYNPYGTGSQSQYNDGFLAGNCGVACGSDAWQRVASLGDIDWASAGSGKIHERLGPVKVPGPNGNFTPALSAAHQPMLGSVGVAAAADSVGAVAAASETLPHIFTRLSKLPFSEKLEFAGRFGGTGAFVLASGIAAYDANNDFREGHYWAGAHQGLNAIAALGLWKGNGYVKALSLGYLTVNYAVEFTAGWPQVGNDIESFPGAWEQYEQIRAQQHAQQARALQQLRASGFPIPH